MIIKLYPLTQINIENILFFAQDSGFTITNYNTKVDELGRDGAFYFEIKILQTLTNTQKTNIKDIFRGLIYVKFS